MALIIGQQDDGVLQKQRITMKLSCTLNHKGSDSDKVILTCFAVGVEEVKAAFGDHGQMEHRSAIIAITGGGCRCRCRCWCRVSFCSIRNLHFELI